MVVGEFYPAGGYFTRMLSDVVGQIGHIYAVENAGWNNSVKDDKAMLAEGKWKNVSLDVQPFGMMKFTQPLDLAWVTQNYHDMKIANMATSIPSRSIERFIGRSSQAGPSSFSITRAGPG